MTYKETKMPKDFKNWHFSVAKMLSEIVQIDPTKTEMTVLLTTEELDAVKLAAELSGETVEEFVVRAALESSEIVSESQQPEDFAADLHLVKETMRLLSGEYDQDERLKEVQKRIRELMLDGYRRKLPSTGEVLADLHDFVTEQLKGNRE
jgi:uncharacterized protein (DUF1778 family)